MAGGGLSASNQGVVGQDDPMMEPFTPVVTDEELRDLRARLRATRWPEPETDPSQGVALADLQQCAGTGPRPTTGERANQQRADHPDVHPAEPLPRQLV